VIGSKKGVLVVGVFSVSSWQWDQATCTILVGFLVVLGRKLTTMLIANTGQASFNRQVEPSIMCCQ
jgi:hypothetical protein